MSSKAASSRITYPSHPYRSARDLAAMLIQGGLTEISTSDLAEQIDLVGYYRLKGYWYPFLTPDSVNSKKRKLPFLPNTSWPVIWERYVFDQELRTIVFNGIVTIEVFLKSYVASELARTTGPFGYAQPGGLPNLKDTEYPKALECFRKNFQNSSLPHLKHFRSTYTDELPPIWMLVDCMTFGDFKYTLYRGADSAIKQQLAAKLGIVTRQASHGNERLLGDWIETLRRARNMTAHHERFWNCTNPKLAPTRPRAQPNTVGWWGNDWDPFRQAKAPAVFLTMENYLLKVLNLHHWHNDFIDLMTRHPSIPVEDMGFPPDWRSLSLWI